MNSQVTIIGGGVTGALLTLLLGKAGISVNLIDRGRPSIQLGDLHTGRTASLNLFSIETFRNAGIWNLIEPKAKLFDEIVVWDSEGSSSVNFKGAEISRSELGYIVHNNVILNALYSELAGIEEINIIENESVNSLNFDEQRVLVVTEAGKEFSSDLLVGADGSFSKVRDLSKISIRSWSYDQIALVSSVRTEVSLGNTAYQIFTDTGPIALLPLPGTNKASLIWSTDKEYGNKLLNLDEADLLEELKLKCESRFGNINLCEKVINFPLHQLHAKNFSKNRTILIGDSAHTIHPLAGQGLNLGIADVSEISNLMISAKRNYEDWNDPKIIQRYAKKRQPESYKMIALMEAFKRGFGSKNLWLKLGRNLAFDFADKNQLLKKRLIKEAAGST